MSLQQLLMILSLLCGISCVHAGPPPLGAMGNDSSSTSSSDDSMDDDMMDDSFNDDESGESKEDMSDDFDDSDSSSDDSDKKPEPKPKPATSSSKKSNSSSNSSSSSPATVNEIAEGPLFAPSLPGSQTTSRKDMFAQTEQAEKTVQEHMKAIDDIKSAKMNEYLVLDGELDAHAKEVGLARGKAADSIGDIKDALWQQIDAQVPGGADDGSQKQIDAHKGKVEELEEAVTALSESESVVVKALKEISESVSAALDSGASVATKRLEIKGVIDDAVAQTLFDEIKAVPDELKKVKEELTAGEGAVARLDKAMVDARAQATKVKELMTALKELNLDVSAAVQTFVSNTPVVAVEPVDSEQEAVTVEPAAGESEQEVPADDAPTSKKKTRQRPSMMAKWVKGTPVEGVYNWLADGVIASWGKIKPLGGLIRNAFSWGAKKVGDVAQKHLPVVTESASATPVTPATGAVTTNPIVDGDPVLSKIRQEREEVSKKEAELAKQQQEIDNKEKMLDRMEADRIALIDSKEEVAAELGRPRAMREMSWGELSKGFMRKLYVSVARGGKRVYQWWQGTYDPLAAKKVETPKNKKGEPAAQDAAVVTAKTVDPATLAVPSAAPVVPAVKTATVAPASVGPAVPAGTPVTKEQAEVKANAIIAQIENDQKAAAAKTESVVANALASMDAQVAKAKKNVKKKQTAAFVSLG